MNRQQKQAIIAHATLQISAMGIVSRVFLTCVHEKYMLET